MARLFAGEEGEETRLSPRVMVWIGANSGLIGVTMAGGIDPTDIRDVQQWVQRLAAPEGRRAIVFDVRQVELSRIGAGDVRRAADSTAPEAQARHALVVDTDEAYGMGRMFQAFSEGKSGGVHLEIFRNVADAEDWARRVIAGDAE